MRKTSPRIVFSSSWSRVRQAAELDDEWQITAQIQIAAKVHATASSLQSKSAAEMQRRTVDRVSTIIRDIKRTLTNGEIGLSASSLREPKIKMSLTRSSTGAEPEKRKREKHAAVAQSDYRAGLPF